MRIGRLSSESKQYKAARDALLAAEIALKNQRETVAALRRALPLDTVVEDYVFHEAPRDATGPARAVRLSALFENPDKPLILQHFMYGGAQKDACPMCAMWADGFNGVGPHIGQWANFAVVARAPADALRTLGRAQGWSALRLVSSDGTRFNRDFGFEDADEDQWPGVSVFTRDPDGTVRHFYSGSAILDAEAGDYRGLDMLNPVWNLMDLLPAGRGDWMPDLKYG